VNILLLVDCYLPSTKSSAKLVHDLALQFVELGHAPALVTQDPSIPAKVHISREHGYEVVRAHAGAIKGAPLWTRGLNEALLSSRVWRTVRPWFRERHFDVIAFYAPTIFWGALVRRLKKLYGCPAYMILRDIFPQWALDAGVLRPGPMYWFFKHKERVQYAAADVIGVQSPANLGYFRERGWDERYRLEVLYNWMRLEIDAPRPPTFRRQFGLENKIILFYGGNIGVAQDMDNLLRLAARLRDTAPEAHFLFVGDGSEVPRILRLVAAEQLDNVTIKDALSQEDYLALVSEIDVGLISLDRQLKTQNFPGKMLSYMHAAKPILASINPGNDLQTVVEQANAGFVCENGDDAALAEHALRLVRDAALRRTMGEASRQLLVSRFSARAAAEQILKAAMGQEIQPAGCSTNGEKTQAKTESASCRTK
jgi:glycosyltransferase involved in cell wall biosynthesis